MSKEKLVALNKCPQQVKVDGGDYLCMTWYPYEGFSVTAQGTLKEVMKCYKNRLSPEKIVVKLVRVKESEL